MRPLVKRAIAFAAGIATIGSAFAAIETITPAARGLLDSGPLPVAGRAEVDEKIALLATQLQAIQRANADQARQDAARDALLSTVRQQQLESILAGARADYARSPTSSGRAYVCALIGQVDQLRAANRLPLLPPC